MAGKPSRAPRRPPYGADAGGSGGGVSMLTWLGLSLLILIVDQFTKVMVTGYYKLGDSTTVSGFFNLAGWPDRAHGGRTIRTPRRGASRARRIHRPRSGNEKARRVAGSFEASEQLAGRDQ